MINVEKHLNKEIISDILARSAYPPNGLYVLLMFFSLFLVVRILTP